MNQYNKQKFNAQTTFNVLYVDFFLIVALFFLTIPLVSGYYAYTRGRSFWTWFALGTFFPIIAHIALLFLPKLVNEQAEFDEELASMRLELGIVGTVVEKNNNQHINKVLERPKPKIRFFVHEINQRKIVEIYINGINLRYIISELEPLETNEYEGIPLSLFQPSSLHLLGDPDTGFTDNENRSAILICKSDSYYRSALLAKIEVNRKYVIWHSFQRNQKPNNQYEKLTFVFNKIQYMSALEEVYKVVNSY
jgi:hypothetical protein